MHTTALPASSHLTSCRDTCLACAQECLQTLYQHCLPAGGDHLAPEHVRTMADCAAICQAAADFMTRGSTLHVHVCRACAAVCRACAKSCRGMEGMENCIALCERCAAACEEMGQHDG